MLILGTSFLILGLYSILSRRYEIEKVDGGRNIIEKKDGAKNGLYRYKLFLGIFSVILGIFCFANYFIY